jgi:Fe-S oxidoreductase
MPAHTFFESAAFLALLVISLTVFGRRLATVLGTITGSKRDAGFQLRPLWPRFREVLLEVGLQRRVISERPAAGIAHALVFWGFCGFALVTVDHLAAGFNLGWLRESGSGFARAYRGAVAVFALAVAAAIAGLFVRRFFVRPRWLGEKPSGESGLIAGLIFALMATYLADYFVAPAAASPLGRALWWEHTLALLVFVLLIPHSKHLHLVLSPLSVFLSRGGFAKVPPLEGDEDFGLDTGKDLTRIAALQAWSCVECGRCMEHCPAHHTGKALNPKELVLGLRQFLDNNGAGSGDSLLGPFVSEEAVFQCTTCGACEHQCPVGVEHVPLIIGLRRGAVNTGKWEDEYGGELFLKLERSGNPFGMAQMERDRFVKKLGLPLYDGSQEYLLWLGCMGAYDPRGRETVTALVEVLRHLGVTFGVLAREKCTGDAARRLGNDLVFSQLAETNIAALRGVKAGKILSICPHCVRTINEDWKEFGAEFAAEHHSVLLARMMGRLPGAGAGETFTYHDACYLGRHQGVYDAPRAVVRGSGRLAEPALSGARGFCCGAGGGLVFLGEEKGKRVSHERAEQLVATGAGTVVGACPFCETMLADALPAVAGEGAPKLVDIAQLAAGRLPGKT